jgi:hypothetical protein
VNLHQKLQEALEREDEIHTGGHGDKKVGKLLQGGEEVEGGRTSRSG